jgi:DNA replication and repair protein RecF
MYKETGEYPLLLLDDALSELDRDRQKMLLEYIGKVQTFIALTDPTQIPDVQTSSRQVFRIQSGAAYPEESLSF